MKSICVFLGLILCLCACDQSKTSGFVQVEDGRFVTPDGQQLMLRAINVVNKQKEDDFVPHHTANTYENIRNNGYNSIRLGVNWGGLEPQALQYDETYLKQLDSQIALIKEQGLYIVLDMHQDLYGVKFGGGAPLWAVLDDGKEHTTGEVWSEAYYLSEGVQTAFDNFWDNKIVEQSGIGLQEHYARVWKLLAERYANETAIVGFDIMNEPFAGSGGPVAMAIMFNKLAEIDTNFTIEKIHECLNSPEGTLEILTKLSDIDIYKQVIGASEDVYQTFEKQKLQMFYQHIADSVRTVNPNHILFLEPSVSANNGVRSVIAPTKLTDGQNDAQIAFAPHLYDIVLDTDLASTADGKRLDFILAQIEHSARQHNMPIFVGEWGAFYNNEKCSLVADHYTKMFDKEGISNAYWDFTNEMWNSPLFEMMNTPYPQKVNGKLVSIENKDKRTIVKWIPSDAKSKTVLYVPNVKDMKIVGEERMKTETQTYPNSQNGVVTIDANDLKSERTIILELTN